MMTTLEVQTIGQLGYIEHTNKQAAASNLISIDEH